MLFLLWRMNLRIIVKEFLTLTSKVTVKVDICVAFKWALILTGIYLSV